MTRRTHSAARWSARVAALAVATAATIPLFGAGTANAATVTCKIDTQVFDAKSDGSLWLYQNGDPTSGSATWDSTAQIGSGWQGRTIAGPNGQIYSITPSGELRLYQYNLSTDTWENNAAYVSIGTGWGQFLSGAARTQITVDATGTVYIIDSSGNLRSYYLNPKTQTWVNGAGTILDTGWSKYSRIFAGGPGVIYAVDASGNLFRYRYDSASNRFTEYAAEVGSGWGKVQNVFSPGGDVIYAVDSAGSLFWLRYNDDTHSWDNNGAGTLVGTGWNASGILDVSSTSNTCTVPDPAPVGNGTPIASTATDPIGLGFAQSDQPPFYLFKDAQGHAQYAQDIGATGLSGPFTLGTAALASSLSADTTDSSNVVSLAGLDSNGQAYVARSTDLNAGLVPIEGSLNSISVTHVGNQALITGVDSTGQLWGSWDADGNGHFVAWRSLTAGPAGLSGPLKTTSYNAGKSAYGVAAKSDGSDLLLTGDLSGNASAVAVANATTYNLPTPASQALTPTLFATDKATSNVSMYVPGASGAAGTWTALPTQAVLSGAVSQVSATSVSSTGLLAVAVLGSDNNVYVSTQTAAGSTTFGAWQKIGTEASTTAPTIAWDGHSGVHLAFRGQDGNLYHYAALSPAAGAALSFTGGARTPSS